jgi:hypothetical protein
MILVFILIIITFGLTLLNLASSIVCFLVDRPRAGGFFLCLALDFFRRFAYFLSQFANVTPTSSWSYSTLSSDWGTAVTWGGALFFLVWAWWDFWHNLGGIKGAKAYTQRARATYKALKNSSKSKGQQKEKDKEGDNI